MGQPERYSDGDMLTRAQVADLFNVDRDTVTRWAKSGKLKAVRIPGGQRRYRWEAVREFLVDGDERE